MEYVGGVWLWVWPSIEMYGGCSDGIYTEGGNVLGDVAYKNINVLGDVAYMYLAYKNINVLGDVAYKNINVLGDVAYKNILGDVAY